MPRSSRHKSSKHSSRDAREYSDSEKETSSKDRKSSREESTKAFKETASAEKRKNESNKDYNKDSGNGDYLEEYSSSSKRRKERVEDDRWNGGGDDGNNNDRSEGTKKLKEKSSSESKSKRRDESAAGVVVEIEEVVKKSSGKSEGKHRESSSRKEGREGGTEKDRDREKERDRDRDRDRDRRGKEGKSDKLNDGDDLRVMKQVYDKTESDARELLQSPEPDRRIRRKRDGSSDGDKYRDDIGDSDRRISSREDVTKDGRSKDEKHRDERYRDKWPEDVDKESRHQDEKHRDERATKDHLNSRSDDKHSRDEKSTAEVKPKKNKPQDGDCYHERVCDGDRDLDLERDHHRESYQHDRDYDRERDHCRDKEHDRDRDRDNERDREPDLDSDRGRDRDRDRNRERYHDQDRERDRVREKNLDYDGANVDDRGARYKDSRGRKRSPEYHDDYNDAKTRGGRTSYLDLEKKSLSSNRVESDTDRGRSQSRQAHPDNNKRRTSPSTSSHGAPDEYRQYKQEELKSKDTMVEQRSKSISSREPANLSGSLDRTSKYRSSEKPAKMDDGYAGDLSLERSSSSKASPMGLTERSPSSSLERNRYMNRTGVRRSLDIEESGRRSTPSMGARDLSSADDRPNRDLPVDKSLPDESTSVDSSFYYRNGQNNSTLIPPSSAFRGGVGSPSFLGSLEDARVNTGNRYKRSGDPNLGRGQGNGWRGAPNWSSPMPNGYMPFQHGPPHGGFQAMMPQFPSPPMFGVRPSMEMNHSGIPYHIAEADRFSTHLRPLGWQNMMEGSRSSHMHGWDGNNGVYRDEAHIYGGPEWEQNRHSINDRGWENTADIWKRQNGDQNFDLSSAALKEDVSAQATMDDILAGQGSQRSQNESNHLAVQAKAVDTKVAVNSSMEEFSKSPPKTIREKTPDPPKLSTSGNGTYVYRAYLSKLDISIDLADPELYKQFTSLLNVEQSATLDEDTAVLINLKDGARAVPKSSGTLLNSSLFPMTSDSVFQRAMDIYKRERASFGGRPIVDGGMVDNIAAYKIVEQAPVDVAEEQTFLEGAETSHVQMELDVKKVETVPNADRQEFSHETVSIADEQENSVVTPIQVEDVDAHITDLKLESSAQALPDNPLVIFNMNKTDAVCPKPVDSGAQREDPVLTIEDASDADNLSPIDSKNVDDMGKMEDSNSFNCDEEGKGLDDGMGGGGPLLVKESSPKIAGDLMPESESVILSRIHHSPESTH